MSLEEFAPHVGARFFLDEDKLAPALVLVEAERSPNAGENGRPFHLVFEGSAELPREGGNVLLSRGENPPQPIFLVPIAPDRYEAVFN